jgi:hypothetical protein
MQFAQFKNQLETLCTLLLHSLLMDNVSNFVIMSPNLTRCYVHTTTESHMHLNMFAKPH